MIEDLKREIKQADYRRNFVVVAPRILLAQQLCEEFLEQINNVNVLHVYSRLQITGITRKKSIIEKALYEWIPDWRGQLEISK